MSHFGQLTGSSVVVAVAARRARTGRSSRRAGSTARRTGRSACRASSSGAVRGPSTNVTFVRGLRDAVARARRGPRASASGPTTPTRSRSGSSRDQAAPVGDHEPSTNVEELGPHLLDLVADRHGRILAGAARVGAAFGVRGLPRFVVAPRPGDRGRARRRPSRFAAAAAVLGDARRLSAAAVADRRRREPAAVRAGRSASARPARPRRRAGGSRASSRSSVTTRTRRRRPPLRTSPRRRRGASSARPAAAVPDGQARRRSAPCRGRAPAGRRRRARSSGSRMTPRSRPMSAAAGGVAAPRRRAWSRFVPSTSSRSVPASGSARETLPGEAGIRGA